MSQKMNRESFVQLVTENIEWLMKQPRTLEREHTIGILKECVDFYYPPEVRVPAANEEKKSLRRLQWMFAVLMLATVVQAAACLVLLLVHRP